MQNQSYFEDCCPCTLFITGVLFSKKTVEDALDEDSGEYFLSHHDLIVADETWRLGEM